MPKDNRIYAVKVRENGQKKTKFFRDCKSPSEAAAKYKGSGDVMSVRKIGIEHLYGVGQFFRLGDDIMRDIQHEEQLDIEKARANHSKTQERRIKRRGYDGKPRTA